jgi:integrase/recombinase XerD
MAKASTLTDSDIRKVFRIISIGRLAARNRASFVLSIFAGMRCGSISALRISDVQAQDGSILREIRLTKAQVKGNKAKVVYLSDKVRKELATYLQTHPNAKPDAALIYSQNHNSHFSSLSLGNLFKRIYNDAALPNCSSHSGRRYYASTLNAKGVGVGTIQVLMCHSSLSSTNAYITVTDEQKFAAVGLL